MASHRSPAPLRAALVGTGGIARSTHLPALRTLAAEGATEVVKGLQLTASHLSGQNLWGGNTYVHGEGYLALPDRIGSMAHVSFEEVSAAADHAVITERLTWHPHGGELWAEEERRIETRTDASAAALVFEHAPADGHLGEKGTRPRALVRPHRFVRTAPFAAVAPSWAFHDELVLAPGSTLARGYRVTVADGAWDRARVTAHLHDHAW